MSKRIDSHFITCLHQVWPQVDVSEQFHQLTVEQLTADSREVTDKSVFIALKGYGGNGVEFITHALANGCVAVLVDEHDINKTTGIEKKWQHKLIALPHLFTRTPELLQAFYPAVTDITKIGVTGTNGKTSVTQMIAQLAVLTDQSIGVIGTLGAGIIGKVDTQFIDKISWRTANTTPHLVVNYQLMDRMAQAKVNLMTMEVSSIGIDQRRVAGLGFDVTIMTNLTQDHLDYHGNMSAYEQMKKQFFVDNPQSVMVFNVDDPFARKWYLQFSSQQGIGLEGVNRLIAVGKYDPQHTFTEFLCYQNVKCNSHGFTFTLRSHKGDFAVILPLFGRFNITNVLCAMAALVAQGMRVADLVKLLKLLQAVEGRMEQFDHQGIKVLVDYAHTPDALYQALSSLKEHCQGQLWCIFGCGGNRDKTKRPLMAKAAERFADHIVVTNDNPRHELPQAIAADICAGFALQTQYQLELDRKQAIVMALAQAKADDIVLIAGKGHETYQVFGDDVIEYDERSFVRQCCVNPLDDQGVNTVNKVMPS